MSSPSELFDEEKSPQNDYGIDAASEEEQVDALPKKSLSIAIPLHAKSHISNSEALSMKMPSFLSMDARPFDPKQFTEDVQTHAEGDSAQDRQRRSDDKLIAENTIRWRYAKSDSDELYKQSNSQIVEWSDGSLSLKLGEEIFDILSKPNEDNFLVASHESQEILLTHSVLSKSIKIVPVSIRSQTHQRLTKAIGNRNRLAKQNKVQNVIVNEDLEAKQKALEKLENEKMRAKRKLELKRQKEYDQQYFAKPSKRGQFLDDEEDREIDVSRPAAGYEDDGFVIEDEDEEEAGESMDEDDELLDLANADRLRSVKAAGEKKYESEGGDEDEEETVSRKKRRVVMDDDDDE